MPNRRSPSPILFLVVGLAGCNLSPLQNRIAVGEDRFVVFVAEGIDGNTDIYAGLPAGGELSRITFTPVDESHPAVTPAGDLIAFVRYPPPAATAIPTLIVMNLLNGAERVAGSIATAGGVDALAWTDDRTALLVRGSGITWRVPFPAETGAAEQLAGAARARADSALDVILGTPGFARARQCAGGGVCVIGPSGEPTVLSGTGRSPFRWGSDSVAWFEEDRLMVRPLGPGSAREITWREMPTDMRQGSYAGLTGSR